MKCYALPDQWCLDMNGRELRDQGIYRLIEGRSIIDTKYSVGETLMIRSIGPCKITGIWTNRYYDIMYYFRHLLSSISEKDSRILCRLCGEG